jgi:hypothetical protein
MNEPGEANATIRGRKKMKKWKKVLLIVIGVPLALFIALIAWGSHEYNKMTPEEKAAIEESRAVAQSERESRAAEESRIAAEEEARTTTASATIAATTATTAKTTAEQSLDYWKEQDAYAAYFNTPIPLGVVVEINEQTQNSKRNDTAIRELLAVMAQSSPLSEKEILDGWEKVGVSVASLYVPIKGDDISAKLREGAFWAKEINQQGGVDTYLLNDKKPVHDLDWRNSRAQGAKYAPYDDEFLNLGTV